MLIGADLLGAHWWDVPTIDPSYWTVPPESVARIKADPATIRVFGVAERAAAEPGFASRPVNFFEVRDTLGWSLPPIWGLKSSTGLTPLYPKRVLTFQDHAHPLTARYDVEGVTHLLTGRAIANFPGRTERAGAAVIHYLTTAEPRVRLMGHPVYVADEAEASAALDRLGAAIHDHLIVEDPERRMPKDTVPQGSAPDRGRPARAGSEVEADLVGPSPAYVVLADTYGPRLVVRRRWRVPNDLPGVRRLPRRGDRPRPAPAGLHLRARRLAGRPGPDEPRAGPRGRRPGLAARRHCPRVAPRSLPLAALVAGRVCRRAGPPDRYLDLAPDPDRRGPLGWRVPPLHLGPPGSRRSAQ